MQQCTKLSMQRNVGQQTAFVAQPRPSSARCHYGWTNRSTTCLANRNEITSSLLTALAEQFQKESLPWIRDLVEPIVAGPPPPLQNTVDAQMVADPDSFFITLQNNLRIHYKEYIGQTQPPEYSSTDRSNTYTSYNSSLSSTDGLFIGGSSEPVNILQDTVTTRRRPGRCDDAPNFLLLHGFNGSEFNWRLVSQPVADEIASIAGQCQSGFQPGCRVVAYDRPPFGLSSRPAMWPGSEDTNPYTLAGSVHVAHQLMTELELGNRVIIMGHSAGGPIAMELAARYPELVAGVVLIAPAISTNPKGFLANADLGSLLRFAYIRALLSQDGPGLNYVRKQIRKREAEVRQGRLGVYADDAKFATPEVIENYLRPLKVHDWDIGSLNVFRSLSLATNPDSLKQVTAPVLVIQGAEDRTVTPATSQGVVNVLRQARAGKPDAAAVKYVELPKCGHLPMEELPEDVISAIAGFVKHHCLKSEDRHTNSDRNSSTTVTVGAASSRHV